MVHKIFLSICGFFLCFGLIANTFAVDSAYATTFPSGGLHVDTGYDPSLTQSSNVHEFLIRLTNWVLSFLAILAIVVIIYGGFLMVASAGDSGMYEKGQEAVKWAVIGIVVILFSYAIVNTVINFANGDDGTQSGSSGYIGFGTGGEGYKGFSSDIPGVLEVKVQATPDKGTVGEDGDYDDGTSVVFTMAGTFDNFLSKNPDDKRETQFYMWFGDETADTVNSSETHEYNPVLGQKLCTQDLNKDQVEEERTGEKDTNSTSGFVSWVKNTFTNLTEKEKNENNTARGSQTRSTSTGTSPDGERNSRQADSSTSNSTATSNCIKTTKIESKTVVLDSTRIVHHYYKQPGTYKASFVVARVDINDPSNTMYWYKTIPITMSVKKEDLTVPAPTAGFVYKVVDIEREATKIEFRSTSLDRSGNRIIPATDRRNMAKDAAGNEYKLTWDFHTLLDINGDGDSNNDNDLQEPQKKTYFVIKKTLSRSNPPAQIHFVSEKNAAMLSQNEPDTSVKYEDIGNFETDFWNYEEYTIEHAYDYISPNPKATLSNPARYLVTYRNNTGASSIPVKLKIKDTASMRNDEVIREVKIPAASFTPNDINKNPTALFSYVYDASRRTLRVQNLSYGINGEPLEMSAGSIDDSNIIKVYNPNDPNKTVRYTFSWDIDSKSEKHPTRIEGPARDPAGKIALQCDKIQASENLTYKDDGVPDNDIDSMRSGLKMQGVNIGCPLIFTLPDFGTYDMTLRMTALDESLGNSREYSSDLRTISIEANEPPKESTQGPTAAFIISDMHGLQRGVQFLNTSLRGYNKATESAPKPLTESDIASKDILMSWDFDTSFDSDGDGKKDNDNDHGSECQKDGKKITNLIDCFDDKGFIKNTYKLIDQTNTPAVLSPGRMYRRSTGNTKPFEVDEKKDIYEVKLSLSEKINTVWTTDTVRHSVKFPTSQDAFIPIASFTYNQPDIKSKVVNFSNKSKNLPSPGRFKDTTTLIWDFNTALDSNNDGDSTNDRDLTCITTKNTCPDKSGKNILDSFAKEFPQFGKYKVKLTVQNPEKDGQVESFEQVVWVREDETSKFSNKGKPVAAFTFARNGLLVELRSQSLDSSGKTMEGKDLIWDFDTNFDTNGDGIADNDQDALNTNSLTLESFEIKKLGRDKPQDIDARVIYVPKKEANIALTVREKDSKGGYITDTIKRRIAFDVLSSLAPPQANFKIEKNGTIVSFTNVSTDANGDALSITSEEKGYRFLWDFDLNTEPGDQSVRANQDGNPTNDINAKIFKPTSFDYQQFDTYSAKLKVISPAGVIDEKIVTFSLDEAQSNPDIKAKITANPTKGVAPMTVNFSSIGSKDLNGSISNIMWTFGDDSEMTENGAEKTSVSHIYEVPGHYRAGIAVEGPSGKAISYIYIDVSPGKPEAEILLNRERKGHTENKLLWEINKALKMDVFIDDPLSGNTTDFSYEWNFDDGEAKSTLKNPVYIYREPGDYEITLKVTNTKTSLVSEASRLITIATTPPKAKITAKNEGGDNITSDSSQPAICGQLTPGKNEYIVSFNAKDSTGSPLDETGTTNSKLIGFEWDFGNGKKFMSKNKDDWITHTYRKSGIYRVTLKAIDENDTYGLAEKTVFVGDSTQPIPQFDINPLITTADKGITFDATKSRSLSGEIQTYKWIVGNSPFSKEKPGIEFTGKKITKSFPSNSPPEGFDVQLTVIDKKGLESTLLIQDILVIKSAPPKAIFEIIPSDIASNQFRFDGSDSVPAGRKPETIKFIWDFGDNTETIEGKNVEHVFGNIGEFEVKLTIIQDGQNVSSTKKVAVKNTLIAKIINTDPVVGKAPLKVMFKGKGGTNLKAGVDPIVVAAESWDFGDGQSAVGNEVSHVFQKAGRYKVKYSVFDIDNRSSIDTRVIHVASPDPEPLAVIDEATLRGIKISKNMDIKFSGIKSLTSEGTPDSNGELLSYAWDFGDNIGKSSEPEPSYRFPKAGKFTVKLSVTDGLNSRTSSDTVVVNITTVKPVSKFRVDKSTGTSPLLVTFDSRESSDKDGKIVKYLWNFGDESSITTISPEASHVYKNKTGRRKVYRASLTVIDDDGQEHVSIMSITVDPEG